MSEFMSAKWAALRPYVPGEQPRDMSYVKLNTNESPFAPASCVVEEAAARMRVMNLYPDPTYTELRETLAKMVSGACGGGAAGGAGAALAAENIVVGNGSDEILNWAFAAFCDEGCPAVFPDITYGFYPVFAENNRVPYRTVPLLDDFTVDVAAFCAPGKKTVFLANPNAPTGIALGLSDIRDILDKNAGNVVVLDEAYVDFGGESAAGLVREYPNLLVTQTFSKSRSMAGGRLGFGVAQAALIADIETLRNSTNPYNVNNATVAFTLATLAHDELSRQNCARVAQVRGEVASQLRERGFDVLPSATNFVFARHAALSGEAVYRELRARGVLVRHWGAPRIAAWNRITIGAREQMDALLAALDDIFATTR